MYRMLVENGISKWRGDYSKCYFCSDLVIPDGEDEALKHIIDPNHRLLFEPHAWCRLPMCAELKEVKLLTEDDYCQLVRNNICFKGKAYFCNLCCSSHPRHKAVMEHLKTEKHQRNLKIDFKNLSNTDIIFKLENYFCKRCNRKFKHINGVYYHTKSKSHNRKVIEPLSQRAKEPCVKKILASAHQGEILVTDNPMDTNTKQRQVQVPEHVTKGDLQLDLKKSDLNDQFTEESTDDNLIDYIIITENKIYDSNESSKIICKACDCILPLSDIYTHIYDDQHLKKLHRMNTKWNLPQKEEEYPVSRNEYFYCHLCGLYIRFDDNFGTSIKESPIQCHVMLHLHETFPELQLNTYDIMKFNFKNGKIDFIECLLCNIVMYNDHYCIYIHIKDVSHLSRLQDNLLSNKSKNAESLTRKKLQHLFIAKNNESLFDAKEGISLYQICGCFRGISVRDSYIDHFEQRQTDNSHEKNHVKDELIKKLNENFLFYKCFMCDKSLKSIDHLIEHYLSPGHKYRYENCYDLLIKHNINIELASGKSKEDKTVKNIEKEEVVCDKKVEEPTKKTILVNPNRKNVEVKMEQSSSYWANQMVGYMSPSNYYFHCKICNYYIPREQTFCVQGHCMYHFYKEHPDLQQDIIKIDSCGKNFVIKCLLCNERMHSFNTLQNHFYRRKHVQKMKPLVKYNNYANDKKEWKMYPEVQPLNSPQGFHPRTDFSIDSICFRCYIPDYDPDGCTTSFEYEVISGHKHSLESCKRSQNIFSDIDFYKCYFCNASCKNKETLFDHYKNDPMHKKKMKLIEDKIKSKKNHNEEATNPDTYLVEKVNQSLTMDDDNKDDECSSNNDEEKDDDDDDDDDDDEEVTESTSKKGFMKEKRAPKKEENILHPFNADIEQYGLTYINLCIQPNKQDIFTFDPKDIEQMKFSLSTVIFSYKSNKCVCSACNYEIFLEPQSLFEHLQHENHIENLRDLKNCTPNPEGMSYFDLAKTGLIQQSDNEIWCIVCEQNFNGDDESWKAHFSISHSRHENKLKQSKEKINKMSYEFFALLDNFWYHAYFFYCTICKLDIKGELNFARHLEQPVHQALAKLGNKSYKINKCLTCCSCWYGSPLYSEHCKDYFHNRSMNRRFFRRPILSQRSLRKLHELKNLKSVVRALTDESNHVMRMDGLREHQVLEDIERTVERLYDEAKAYIFGSRSSCLSLVGSDMDVFLDLENVYHQRGSKLASQKYIKRVEKEFFMRHMRLWKKDKILLNPRVPIIKLEHRFTRLKCDLSFMNGLGVEKSQLIRKYIVAYDRCRELILYLKKWFDAINMYGPRAVNAYAITWLTIFYLQAMDIFPSVHQLKQNSVSKIVDGWECGFSENITVHEYATNCSFECLLKGFFRYYAHFDFKTSIVSPLTGKIMKKWDFVSVEKMPMEVEIYKNRLKVEELEYFRYDSPMCIQDPVDLSQNITKGVKKRQLMTFKQHCLENLYRINYS